MAGSTGLGGGTRAGSQQQKYINIRIGISLPPIDMTDSEQLIYLLIFLLIVRRYTILMRCDSASSSLISAAERHGRI